MRRATAEVNVKEVHLTEEQGEKIEFEKVGAILKGQSVQMSQFLNVEEIIGANGITDTYEIKWAVSDEEVASIDTVSGVLKGVKEGTVKVKAVITFFDGAGKAGETVEKETEIVTVTSNGSNLTPSLTSVKRSTDGGATWSVSDKSKLTFTNYFGVKKGDIDKDGEITMNDVILCLNHVSKKKILTGEALAAADVDGNGVSMNDVIKLLNFVSKKNSDL